jgi:hypothetical protein
VVKEPEVIDLYAREYARLECERAQLNSRQPNEDEALKRMKSLQRKLRRREFERFVTDEHGAPAVKRGITAIRLDLPTRRGIYIARRFFSSILAWFVAFRGPRGAAGKEKNAMRFK